MRKILKIRVWYTLLLLEFELTFHVLIVEMLKRSLLNCIHMHLIIFLHLFHKYSIVYLTKLFQALTLYFKNDNKMDALF